MWISENNITLANNGMPRASKTLFQETVDRTLLLSHNDKWQWLASVKAARDQHRRATARSTVAQWNLLRNWLQPQQLAVPWPPPDPDPTGTTNHPWNQGTHWSPVVPHWQQKLPRPMTNSKVHSTIHNSINQWVIYLQKVHIKKSFPFLWRIGVHKAANI